MLVRPKGTNLVMMMMTNNVGQAERHQPGDDDDDDDDEGDEEEDNMPKGTNLMITKMTMTRTNNGRHGVLFTIRTWPRVFVAASHQQNQLSIRQMTTHGKAR